MNKLLEEELKGRLQRIFGLKKSTLSLPGESREQDTLFIGIESARTRVIGTRFSARVSGTIVTFTQNDKMPIGYLAKAIAEANPTDVSPFFFHDFEDNTRVFQNIVERTLNFVFFYETEYDPEQGSLTGLEITDG